MSVQHPEVNSQALNCSTPATAHVHKHSVAGNNPTTSLHAHTRRQTSRALTQRLPTAKPSTAHPPPGVQRSNACACNPKGKKSMQKPPCQGRRCEPWLCSKGPGSAASPVAMGPGYAALHNGFLGLCRVMSSWPLHSTGPRDACTGTATLLFDQEVAKRLVQTQP